MSRITRRTLGLVSCSLALAMLAACSESPSTGPETAADAPAAGAGVTVFTGARLLVGDGTVIDNATFTVGPDNRFGLVGATAAVTVPAGATTVDLTGRTVMPAIVDTHTHLSRDRARAHGRSQASRVLRRQRRDELGPGQRRRHLRDAPRGHPRARALSHGGPRVHGARAGPQRHPRTGSRRPTKGAPACASRPRSASTSSKCGSTTAWASTRSSRPSSTVPSSRKRTSNGLRITAHDTTSPMRKSSCAAASTRSRTACASRHRRRVRRDAQGAADFVVVPNLPDRGVAQDMSWLASSLPADRSRSCRPQPRSSGGAGVLRRSKRATSSA